jgi:hypothetical protein
MNVLPFLALLDCPFIVSLPSPQTLPMPPKKLNKRTVKEIKKAYKSPTIERKNGIMKRVIHHEKVRRRSLNAYTTLSPCCLLPLEPLRRRKYLTPASSEDIKRALSLKCSSRTVRRIAGRRRDVVCRYRKAMLERKRVKMVQEAAAAGHW